MASKIDIWNLALSHIGHRANVGDPDEASVEANHCRRFYPIALGAALERHSWAFSTRRAQLAEVDNPLNQWAFAYALPNSCKKAWEVLPPESTDLRDGQPFVIETSDTGDFVLYTNMEDAVLRYGVLVTDTTKYSDLFILTLSYELASMLVGPIPKDAKMKKAMLDAAAYYASIAQAADANASQDSSYQDFTPSHLAARA